MVYFYRNRFSEVLIDNYMQYTGCNFGDMSMNNGGTSNFHLGATALGVWATEIPQGVQWQSPGRGLGVSPPEAHAVCRYCLQILTTEAIKI